MSIKLAALVMAGLAAGFNGGASLAPPTMPVFRMSKRALLRASSHGNGVIQYGYPKRTGWTNASYRRAAVKAKNQSRNRLAHRGY